MTADDPKWEVAIRTNMSNWKDTAELVGIAAIVASLVFVGQQLRQDRNVAQADAWLQLVETQVSLAQLIGEHADVWSRGLNGEELSDTDQLKFNQIAFAVEQQHASRFARSNLGIRRRSANDAAVDYAEEVYMYPGLRVFFESRLAMRHRRGSDAGLGTAVAEHLLKLDSGEIEPPTRDGHAF